MKLAKPAYSHELYISAEQGPCLRQDIGRKWAKKSVDEIREHASTLKLSDPNIRVLIISRRK